MSRAQNQRKGGNQILTAIDYLLSSYVYIIYSSGCNFMPMRKYKVDWRTIGDNSKFEVRAGNGISLPHQSWAVLIKSSQFSPSHVLDVKWIFLMKSTSIENIVSQWTKDFIGNSLSEHSSLYKLSINYVVR